MDILEELNFLQEVAPREIYLRAGDAIVLEREISAKLYRALLSVVSEARESALVSEALECYEITRLIDLG